MDNGNPTYNFSGITPKTAPTSDQLDFSGIKKKENAASSTESTSQLSPPTTVSSTPTTEGGVNTGAGNEGNLSIFDLLKPFSTPQGVPPYAVPKVSPDNLKENVDNAVQKIHNDNGYQWDKPMAVIGDSGLPNGGATTTKQIDDYLNQMKVSIENNPATDPITKLAATSYVNSVQGLNQGMDELANAKNPITSIIKGNGWDAFELPAALVKTGFSLASLVPATPTTAGLAAFNMAQTAADKVLPSDVMATTMSPFSSLLQQAKASNGLVAIPFGMNGTGIKIFDIGNPDTKKSAAEIGDLLYQIALFKGSETLAGKVIHNLPLTPIEQGDLNKIVDESAKDATALDRAAYSKVPQDLTDDQKTQLTPLVRYKYELQKQKENVDEAFHAPLDAEIENVNNKINEVVNPPAPEQTDLAQQAADLQKEHDDISQKVIDKMDELKSKGTPFNESEALTNLKQKQKDISSHLKQVNDALQKQSTSSVLQHPQETVGETGGGRERVESSQQGNETPPTQPEVTTPQNEAVPKEENVTPPTEQSPPPSGEVVKGVAQHKQFIQDQFRKQFKAKEIPDEQIDGALALMDARAKSAASNGEVKSADEWYQKIADVKSGEFMPDSKSVLFQMLDDVDVFNSNDVNTAKAFITKVFDTIDNKADAKTAYRKLAIKYHPDKNPSPSAKAIFQHLNNTNENFTEIGKSKGKYDNFYDSGQYRPEPFTPEQEAAFQKRQSDFEKNKEAYKKADELFTEKRKEELIAYDEKRKKDLSDFDATQEAEKKSFYNRQKPTREESDAYYKKQRLDSDTFYKNRAKEESDFWKKRKSDETEFHKKYNYQFQKNKGGIPQGAVETLSDGRVVIHALDAPDFSTMVHEIAHVFEKDLSAEETKLIEKNGGSEAFARGFERYLREGKSPNATLTPLFEKFKEWLTNIYQSLKGSPIAKKLTPEIRQTFDRLLSEKKEPSAEVVNKGVSEEITPKPENQNVVLQPEARPEVGQPDNGSNTETTNNGGAGNIEGGNQGEVIPPPPEEPKTEEGQKPPNTVGVSHKSLTNLAESMGLKLPERGEFLPDKWYADRGRQLLKAGADPNEVDNPNAPLHDRISIGRAHLENLKKQADEIARTNPEGVNSKEYQEAFKALDDYAQKVKSLGTDAHRAMVALQGERDLDTDSFSSVKKAFKDSTGNEPSKEQSAKIKSLTEENARLRSQAAELERKLIEATNNDIAKERPTRKQAAKAKLDEARLAFRKAAGLSSGGLEALPEFVKLVKAYVEYGFESAKEAWEQFKKDFPKANVNQDEFAKQFDAQRATAAKERGSDLEELQKQFVDKKGNKFTIDEAKAIWDYGRKNYLDQGYSYREMVSMVANDLGLSWRQVSEAISTPKTKPISDEMWKKQADYRRNQQATKNWMDTQNRSIYVRALRKASGLMRGEAVFGHAGIFMGTHAGMTLMQPSTWKYTIPAFFRAWKFGYGNPAAYEMAMEELRNRPNYVMAQRAGLKNNPDIINAEEYQKSQEFLGKLGLAGQRGFNAIKVLRQDLFDWHWNQLSDAAKADPKSAEQIARLINNATGATNLKLPEWVNEVSFAGGMEAARWGKLTRNPMRATAIAIKAIVAPDKTTTAEKVFAKVWARRVGEQVGTMAALLTANALIQHQLNPKNPTNLTNPNQSDFLKFKFGNTTIDPTSGMLGTAQFMYGLGRASTEPQKQLGGDTRLQKEAKNTFSYGRGKLAPLYSTLADFATKTDFYGNPLPFSSDKPQAGKHTLTWPEYLMEKAPIPVAEASKVMFQAAQDQGATKPQLNNIMQGIMSGAAAGGTGFRIGEYQARPTPFTDEDLKDPTFKYFTEGWGMALPNTSLSSEKIHDTETQTIKSVSDYSPEIQKQYIDTHKENLQSELSTVKQRDHVWVNNYGDVKVDIPTKDDKGYRMKSLKDLTDDQKAQVLSIAQKKATEETKDKIFGTQPK